MQTHKDTAEASLAAVWSYLVALSGQQFYGEVTFKFRKGTVVGHAYEHRDYLVNGLPQATPGQIIEALKGVGL